MFQAVATRSLWDTSGHCFSIPAPALCSQPGDCWPEGHSQGFPRLTGRPLTERSTPQAHPKLSGLQNAMCGPHPAVGPWIGCAMKRLALQVMNLKMSQSTMCSLIPTRRQHDKSSIKQDAPKATATVFLLDNKDQAFFFLGPQ